MIRLRLAVNQVNQIILSVEQLDLTLEDSIGVHLIFANIFVGAKHSGSKSLILINKLSIGMLRPCKIEMHPSIVYD